MTDLYTHYQDVSVPRECLCFISYMTRCGGLLLILEHKGPLMLLDAVAKGLLNQDAAKKQEVEHT